ncbi:MAG: hypothetical protein CL961_06780 [Euryarchaeota archaeon]|nr:hypothetical protein [Euryarchaeota archaeon]MAH09358.1 hypothetical protein [Euryarchaeota archaeon]|tara:strand:- start:184 stop:912 length:729 start_codon:yes stop_codon:yes gene_type:complete
MDICQAKSQLESLTTHLVQSYTTLQQQLNEKDLECNSKMKTLLSEKQSLCKTLEEKESQIESLTAEVASQKQQIASLEKQTPEPAETPENKFDMLRSQAREISAKDKEIMRLTKEIAKLKELNEVKSNVTMTVVESPEPVEGWSPTTSTTPKPAPEVPEINLEEPPKDSEVNEDEVVEDEDDEDDEDEALFEITYRKIHYYRDSNNKVYEKLGEGEPGNYIGDWIKDGTYKSGNDKYKLVKL